MFQEKNKRLVRNIFEMLAYVFRDLGKGIYSRVSCEDFEDADDLLAEILGIGVVKQLKKGLNRQYVDVDEHLHILRGKIDVTETSKLQVKREKLLACRHDEYTENNILNQIVKTTMLILLRNSNVNKERKARIKKLLLFFSDIEDVDVRNVKWNTIKYDRNNQSYRLIIQICRFVLEKNLMTMDKGRFYADKYKIDRMCWLYEHFILEYYKREHPELNPCSKEIKWNIGGEDKCDLMPSMRTDIFLSIGERKLIIDAKYYSKTLIGQYENKTLISYNLYQIFSYVMNEDTEHSGKVDGMLLYAKTDEDILPDCQQKMKDGNELIFKTLDLTADFKEIKQQLDMIVSFIK